MVGWAKPNVNGSIRLQSIRELNRAIERMFPSVRVLDVTSTAIQIEFPDDFDYKQIMRKLKCLITLDKDSKPSQSLGDLFKKHGIIFEGD